ncbi:MAG: hypothetical protein UU73_C0005G0038 [Candidatus Daviesbacteria bacterium GW2011_GWA1_41_61]|uniref:EamA domain-containing protein n=1 Tax=Candidatus Daviesbacteria bacterium GW2011_GWA2_40_9 TaxID=1618424 RepID=A0A0G0U3H8_9BACT|nr:MAG: hypothetical protein UU26_C0023G0008 [Candidatus Daviesbacteria bacterium GW2011_GWC1_40_9]KKR83633.1 MAG: hypothetical protein UU29_C0003G0035 [Candidatus Daviesbacteria bacterium GW2011_GWA2_40_9]KKR92708.1 MAG: hypothetical protein UU44_C0005G0038 [Candidatus Daviesbacteria bacterium GW2011_GWB1_41_15]KKS14639.1 MAG: hypothetical protein UU73_C0005G0038 [Candidatus Daviesbacteria bacterium GW2011_GWA1_41_61]
MSFLPIAVLAYALSGGAIIIDKILLKTSLPNPLTYAFYISLLQLLVLLLIPFGFSLNLGTPAYLAIISGIFYVFALYTFFASLKKNEASVVGPLVGMLNPFFTILLGSLFLSQTLTPIQNFAVFILILGALILTLNIWRNKLQFNRRILWIITSGLLFALSYLLLREAFFTLSFLDGLIVSRTSSGLFVLTFLIFPHIKKQIFTSNKSQQTVSSKSTLILLASGQTMGALSGLLIAYGVKLANPALVNSLFGIQYLVILTTAIFLAKNRPQLLDETLSKAVITQKVVGAAVLSLGLYLLAV